MFIIMGKRHGQFHHCGLAVRFWHDADTVPFYRFHEDFCYAIIFRAAYCLSCKAQAPALGRMPMFRAPCKPNHYPLAIPAARWQMLSNRFFDCAQHDILQCLFVIAICPSRPVCDLPAAAVLREGYTQFFAVVAAELKSILAPAPVTTTAVQDDLAVRFSLPDRHHQCVG
ncbi:UNVERIFIED_ORG: hypothetical protein FHW05_001820 [Pantoea agglomerans]